MASVTLPQTIEELVSEVGNKAKNPYQEYNLALKAPIQPTGTKPPTFSVNIKENNPVLIVRTGIDNDRNRGVIEGPTNTFGFYAMLEMIEQVAITIEPSSLIMVLKGHPFNGTERSKEKRPVATFKVEKHGDGVITLTLAAGDSRPRIDFPLMVNDYHEMRNSQGAPLPKELAYRLSAKAFVKYNCEWMANALSVYAEPAWKKKRDGQNNDNHSRNHQAQSSAVTPSTTVGDFEFDGIL